MTPFKTFALALLSCFAAAAQDWAGEPHGSGNTSVYSSLDEKVCQTRNVSDEDASSAQVCPGPSGFRLRVLDEDARVSLTVISPGGREHPLRFTEVVSSHFSSLGPRAEWRMHGAARGAVPVAVTVRVNVNDDSADTAKLTSYLVVSRVDAQSACVVKVIKSSASALQAAREAADHAGDLSCLKP